MNFPEFLTFNSSSFLLKVLGAINSDWRTTVIVVMHQNVVSKKEIG